MISLEFEAGSLRCKRFYCALPLSTIGDLRRRLRHFENATKMHPERPRPIRDTAAELAIMAQDHGLEALVFTLGMVHLEASSRLAEIGGVPALGMPQWDGADIHTKETATLAS